MNFLKLKKKGAATHTETQAGDSRKSGRADRRSEARPPVRQQATCIWIDREDRRQSHPIQVLDSSEEGLGFRLSHRLESGQTVWVEIDTGTLLKGVIRFCEWDVDGYRAGITRVRRERRRFDREPSGGAGTLYWAESTNRQTSAPVVVRNKTSEGLQLEIPVAVPISTVVRLVGSTLECQGFTRYCRAAEGHYLVGIEFLSQPCPKSTLPSS